MTVWSETTETLWVSSSNEVHVSKIRRNRVCCVYQIMFSLFIHWLSKIVSSQLIHWLSNRVWPVHSLAIKVCLAHSFTGYQTVSSPFIQWLSNRVWPIHSLAIKSCLAHSFTGKIATYIYFYIYCTFKEISCYSDVCRSLGWSLTCCFRSSLLLLHFGFVRRLCALTVVFAYKHFFHFFTVYTRIIILLQKNQFITNTVASKPNLILNSLPY